MSKNKMSMEQKIGTNEISPEKESGMKHIHIHDIVQIDDKVFADESMKQYVSFEKRILEEGSDVDWYSIKEKLSKLDEEAADAAKELRESLDEASSSPSENEMKANETSRVQKQPKEQKIYFRGIHQVNNVNSKNVVQRIMGKTPLDDEGARALGWISLEKKTDNSEQNSQVPQEENEPVSAERKARVKEFEVKPVSDDNELQSTSESISPDVSNNVEKPRNFNFYFEPLGDSLEKRNLEKLRNLFSKDELQRITESDPKDRIAIVIEILVSLLQRERKVSSTGMVESSQKNIIDREESLRALLDYLEVPWGKYSN